ncbi:MAG: SGNH/GDSL hydrolase family protein [Spirochaetia bacterium]|nr:SGNH/GDSL hydrolase family protein [Spirochaetia bacterium]
MSELVKFLKDPRFYVPVLFLVSFELFMQTGIYKNYLQPRSYADNVNQISKKIKESKLDPDTLIIGTSVAYQGVQVRALNDFLRAPPGRPGHVVQSAACEGAMLEVQHTLFKDATASLPRIKTLVHISEVTFPWTARFHLETATRSMLAQFPRSQVIPLLKDYRFDLTYRDTLYFYVRSLTYQADLRDAFLDPLDRFKGIARRKREPYSDYVYENNVDFRLSAYPARNLEECMKSAERGIPPVDKAGRPVTDRHHQQAVWRTCQVGMQDPMKQPGGPQWARLYFDRLALLYAEARSKGIEVITVLPPYSDLIADFNGDERMLIWREELKRAQATDQIRLIDLRRSLDGPGNRDYYYDTIHLNREGSLLFTKKLAEALQKEPGYALSGSAKEAKK